MNTAGSPPVPVSSGQVERAQRLVDLHTTKRCGECNPTGRCLAHAHAIATLILAGAVAPARVPAR